MRVLILGGTGAMGQPLAKALSDAGNAVYVTSRQPHKDYGGLHTDYRTAEFFGLLMKSVGL